MQGLPNSNPTSEDDISQAQARIPRPAFDRRAIPDGAREGQWRAGDGHAIRRIDWLLQGGEARGSLLFLPGRGDNYEKYLETLDHWAQSGWNVTAIDWRGQGASGRFGSDAVTGHIEDYAQWLDDLAGFWSDWTGERPGPHVAVGHSMGGHILLRALVEQRVAPRAAVLIAPMLGFVGNLPQVISRWTARLMSAIGDPRRQAWRWNENPGEFPAGRINLLTHDADRYSDELWWRSQRPELVMGPGSWGWVGASLRSMAVLNRAGALEGVTTPTMIVATSADKLVSASAIDRAAERLPNVTYLRMGSEAAHEILREVDPVRDRALAAIDGFLDDAAEQAK